MPIAGSARSFSFSPVREYRRSAECASVIQFVTNWSFTIVALSRTSVPGASGMSVFQAAGAGFGRLIATSL